MAEDTILFRTLTSGKGWAGGPAPGQSSGNGRVGYLNLPKVLAALNRKNYRHTDNKGYPICYVVEVEAFGSVDNRHEVEVFTAPETWVLKNAVRKWHIARKQMLTRAGIEPGEYMKTMRPYLDNNHRLQVTAGAGDLKPMLFQTRASNQTVGFTNNQGNYTEAGAPQVIGTDLQFGEWTYTEVAHATDLEDGADDNITDRYSLVLTGDHDNNNGTEDGDSRYYEAVSMMRSYMESRRHVSVPLQNQVGGASQVEPNPLLGLMMDSVAAGEVSEIVTDIQREKPPYQDLSVTEDHALSSNAALDLVSKCRLATSTSYLKDKDVIRIPMGLCHIRTTATAAMGSSSDNPQIRFRILGTELCQG